VAGHEVDAKQVDVSESVIRVIARRAEAERVRRAKIIDAGAERQAAEKLVEAAEFPGRAPTPMQLRYLGALHDIAGDRANSIVLPLPTDLIHALSAMRLGTGVVTVAYTFEAAEANLADIHSADTSGALTARAGAGVPRSHRMRWRSGRRRRLASAPIVLNPVDSSHPYRRSRVCRFIRNGYEHA
jgi:hypothetical protein